MKKIAFPVIASLALATSAFAGHEVAGKETKEYKQPAPPVLCFQDQEFQLDVFASYTDSHASNIHGDGFGGGLALNYFFIRHFGVGVDGNVYDGENRGDDDAVYDFTGRLIARFPIDEICLAPYVFGGGGVEFNGRSFGTVHAGGGLEYRATETIGVFGEGRFTWGENDRDSAQARVGVRFVF